MYEKGVDIRRYGNKEHDSRRNNGILPFIFFQSRINSQNQSEGNTENQGIGIDHDCSGEFRDKNIPYILSEVQFFADSPITVNERAIEENEILYNDGLIVAQCFAASQNEFRIFAELGSRSERQKFHEYKTDGHDDKESK